MTIEAGKPAAAALEFYRDDIERRVPVAAARLGIDPDSKHLASVNNSHE